MKKVDSMRFSLFIIIFILIGCEKKDSNNFHQVVINDTLTGYGQMQDSIKIGYWKYYNSEKKVIAISEYKILNNKSYLNQEIAFDKNGDTIPNRSSYFLFEFKDNDKVDIKFKKILDQESYSFFVYSDKINSNFSNVDDIKLDTIFFKDDRITINTSKDYLRGLIREIKFTSDTSFMDRDVYVDINKNSKDISTVSKQ